MSTSIACLTICASLFAQEEGSAGMDIGGGVIVPLKLLAYDNQLTFGAGPGDYYLRRSTPYSIGGFPGQVTSNVAMLSVQGSASEAIRVDAPTSLTLYLDGNESDPEPNHRMTAYMRPSGSDIYIRAQSTGEISPTSPPTVYIAGTQILLSSDASGLGTTQPANQNDGLGELWLSIGGLLQVPATAARGSYSGTFTVSTEYWP
jgi:hypothetical protein